MSPCSARMVVLAWCGLVWAVVADWAAGFGCCGTVVVVGAGGGGVVCVPRGSWRGVVRCGWTRALVGASRPAGGRVGGPPEAWADTAPEEIAAYLRITCRRFNNALSLRKGTPYPLSALLYPAHYPHPGQQKPPEGWASFRDAHLAAPDEATATRMGLTDQETYVRGLKTSLQEAHRWHARSPSAPRGQGGSPAPDTHRAQVKY